MISNLTVCPVGRPHAPRLHGRVPGRTRGDRRRVGPAHAPEDRTRIMAAASAPIVQAPSANPIMNTRFGTPSSIAPFQTTLLPQDTASPSTASYTPPPSFMLNPVAVMMASAAT